MVYFGPLICPFKTKSLTPLLTRFSAYTVVFPKSYLINYPSFICKATLATNWNYEKQGADWTDESGPGPCKSGTSQSPIDLKTPKFDNNLKGTYFF